MYSRVKLHTHLYIPTAELRHPIEYARALFTVVPRSFGYRDQKDPIPVYKEAPGWFGIPLHHFQNPAHIAHNVIDLRENGSAVDCTFTAALRDEQRPVYAEFLDGVDQGSTAFLLDARPGFGKTVMLFSMMCKLGRTTLVIVPKTDLMDQWRDRALQHTSLREDDIGIVWQKKCQFVGKKLVIASLGSLLSRRYPAGLYNYFGTVCFDECHRLGAPTFSRVVSLFPARYRLSASATLERKDGCAEVFRMHLGQHILRVTNRSVDSLNVRVGVFKYFDPQCLEHQEWFAGMSGKAKRGKLLSRLATDPARNMMLASVGKQMMQSSRQVIGLSDRVEQLDTLQKLLIGRHGIKSSDVGLYTGPIVRKLRGTARQKLVRDSKILLATYPMCSEGTDIETLSGLFFATPISSVTQSAGRLLRVAEKLDPAIFDVVDYSYEQARRWYGSRLGEYRQMKAIIKELG